jgi:hypothetical protein
LTKPGTELVALHSIAESDIHWERVHPENPTRMDDDLDTLPKKDP